MTTIEQNRKEILAALTEALDKCLEQAGPCEVASFEADILFTFYDDENELRCKPALTFSDPRGGFDEDGDFDPDL